MEITLPQIINKMLAMVIKMVVLRSRFCIVFSFIVLPHLTIEHLTGETGTKGKHRLFLSVCLYYNANAEQKQLLCCGRIGFIFELICYNKDKNIFNVVLFLQKVCYEKAL